MVCGPRLPVVRLRRHRAVAVDHDDAAGPAQAALPTLLDAAMKFLWGCVFVALVITILALIGAALIGIDQWDF